MNDISHAVNLPLPEESIAPVTILDGEGHVVGVVTASEFRRRQQQTRREQSPDEIPGSARPRRWARSSRGVTAARVLDEPSE
jgi:hypothetical protein